MPSGGGVPPRSDESRSPTRLCSSCIALCTLRHDSPMHAHCPSAFAIFESTSLRKTDQASMSYGGFTNLPTPLPHACDALSAAPMQELLTKPACSVGADDVELCFRNFGERYFQARKAMTRMTIHLTTRDRSITRGSAFRRDVRCR